MRDIKFNCPHCGQHISIDEAGRGCEVNCPNCRKAIAVPSTTGYCGESIRATQERHEAKHSQIHTLVSPELAFLAVVAAESAVTCQPAEVTLYDLASRQHLEGMHVGTRRSGSWGTASRAAWRTCEIAQVGGTRPDQRTVGRLANVDSLQVQKDAMNAFSLNHARRMLFVSETTMDSDPGITWLKQPYEIRNAKGDTVFSSESVVRGR